MDRRLLANQSICQSKKKNRKYVNLLYKISNQPINNLFQYKNNTCLTGTFDTCVSEGVRIYHVRIPTIFTFADHPLQQKEAA